MAYKKEEIKRIWGKEREVIEKERERGREQIREERKKECEQVSPQKKMKLWVSEQEGEKIQPRDDYIG